MTGRSKLFLPMVRETGSAIQRCTASLLPLADAFTFDKPADDDDIRNAVHVIAQLEECLRTLKGLLLIEQLRQEFPV